MLSSFEWSPLLLLDFCAFFFFLVYYLLLDYFCSRNSLIVFTANRLIKRVYAISPRLFLEKN